MVVTVQGAFNTRRVRRVCEGAGECLYLVYSCSVVWFCGWSMVTRLVLVEGKQISRAIIARTMGVAKEEVAGKCEDL